MIGAVTLTRVPQSSHTGAATHGHSSLGTATATEVSDTSDGDSKAALLHEAQSVGGRTASLASQQRSVHSNPPLQKHDGSYATERARSHSIHMSGSQLPISPLIQRWPTTLTYLLSS